MHGRGAATLSLQKGWMQHRCGEKLTKSEPGQIITLSAKYRTAKLCCLEFSLRYKLVATPCLEMEAAGLAVGVVGICGLFTTCADLINHIKDAQEMGKEYGYDKNELGACLTLFKRWGEGIGVVLAADGTYKTNELTANARLNRLYGDTKQSVYRSLAAIERMLFDLKGLENGYGLHILGEKELGQGTSTSMDETRSAASGLVQTLQKLPAVYSRKSKSKLYWAIRDKQKFRHLITRLSTLVKGLQDLVPIEAHGETEIASLRETIGKLSLSTGVSIMNLYTRPRT